jgi:general stress protein YciG
MLLSFHRLDYCGVNDCPEYLWKVPITLPEMLVIMNNEILQKPSKRGFAAMSLEQQRLIASKGGKAAHQKGTAHEWTPEEARQAARKSALAAKSKTINRAENDGCDYIL